MPCDDGLCPTGSLLNDHTFGGARAERFHTGERVRGFITENGGMDDCEFAGLDQYQRLEHNGIGIYVNPDYPDWFIPNSAADRVLRTILENDALRQRAPLNSDASRSRHAL